MPLTLNVAIHLENQFIRWFKDDEMYKNVRQQVYNKIWLDINKVNIFIKLKNLCILNIK